MDKNQSNFDIDVIGDITGKTWKGQFKVRLRLSHRQQLKEDETRRLLLGAAPESPSPRARNAADIFSFLHARVVDAPQWWEANGSGLDIEDDNVIGEIYAKTVDAIAASQKEAQEKAKAIQKQMGDETKAEE